MKSMGSFHKASLDKFTPKIYWNKFIRIFVRMEWTKFCSVGFYLLRAKITGKLHQAVFMWCWGSNPRFYECQVPIELHAPDTILILSNRWWLNNSKYIQAIRCCAAIKEKWIQNNLLPGQALWNTVMDVHITVWKQEKDVCMVTMQPLSLETLMTTR